MPNNYLLERLDELAQCFLGRESQKYRSCIRILFTRVPQMVKQNPLLYGRQRIDILDVFHASRNSRAYSSELLLIQARKGKHRRAGVSMGNMQSAGERLRLGVSGPSQPSCQLRERWVCEDRSEIDR